VKRALYALTLWAACSFALLRAGAGEVAVRLWTPADLVGDCARGAGAVA
jgi:hypothetical protein